MKTKLKFLIISLSLLSCVSAKAQVSSSFYTDFGRNNVSQGVYMKCATIVDYYVRNTTIAGGLQANLKDNVRTGLSGLTLSLSQKIKASKFPLEIKGFYTAIRPAGILEETNWGVQLINKRKHFDLSAGLDFKSFRLSDNWLGESIDSKKMREVCNLIYSFSYHLDSESGRWKASIAVTNTDYFSITQETNPEINITCLFRLKSNADIYAQGWFKSAGWTNRVPDSFGYFLRIGIIWKIN